LNIPFVLHPNQIVDNEMLMEGVGVVISDSKSTKSTSSAPVVVVRAKSGLSKPHGKEDVLLSFMGTREAL
jgi:hypothetical protein